MARRTADAPPHGQRQGGRHGHHVDGHDGGHGEKVQGGQRGWHVRPWMAVRSVAREKRWPVAGRYWNATDRKSTRLNSSHLVISYAVFCLKKKNRQTRPPSPQHS